MTILKLSVTDFAQKSFLTGDIDQGSALAQVDADLGAEIHRKIQKRRAKENLRYQSESSLKYFFEASMDLQIEVSGRIDGMWTKEDGGIVLEEIKSTYNIKKLVRNLDLDPHHPYLNQLRLYVWIAMKSLDSYIDPHLLIVGAGSGSELVYPVTFDYDEMNIWIQKKLNWIEKMWKTVEEFKSGQRKRGSFLKFPFAKQRPGQASLTRDVSEACTLNRSLLAQAPTGLGKTAAVIVPVLTAAMLRGEKLFHVTPKNTQLREAEKLFKKLQENGSPLKAMIVTAKAKICMQDEPICNPDICRFARGHYDKVNEHNLIDILKETALINQTVLQDCANRFEVCPYELGRQLMPWVDALAGDYHYVLSPHANFRETSSLPFEKEPKPLLTIDEAHNLGERAIEWYTAQVGLIPEIVIQAAPRALQSRLREVNNWLQKHLELLPVRSSSGAKKIRTIDRLELSHAVSFWSSGMPKLLETLTEPTEMNPIVTHWFAWLEFLAMSTLPEQLFFAMGDTSHKTITFHCANAGPLLKEKLQEYSTVIAFSATLKPFEFHARMCGFDESTTTNREYSSPFPAKNRCIIAIPQVSTAFKDRAKSIPRIADVINRVTKIRRGNYIAFFPSFELLRQTLPFIQNEELEIFEQPGRASAVWTKGMLNTLKRRRNVLLLAVQGGVLSEGVDLPGERLIGAFVVGPALPMITPEREERRRLLGHLYGDGFSFAYINPAVARSVQAAGRVVRTRKDRGIIVLIDPRFLEPKYAQALPHDWLVEGSMPRSLVSQSILKDIADFWKNEK
ncbi:MAG: hypothetical protein NTV34_04770 [Proteobacteria bacterium]|nr:hypothetical protein [Pseudomonadota bacterium]